jgi:hypothetical protein
MPPVALLLSFLACTPPNEGNNPSNDDTGVPPDDSGRDDTGKTDDSTPPDDTSDDSAEPETFEVEVTLIPEMVNEIRADISLGRAQSIRVACEAPEDGPWPERVLARDGQSRRDHSMVIEGLLAATTYTCTVMNGKQVLGTFDATTDPLPKNIDFVHATVEFDDTTAFEPGWTLYTPTQHDLVTGAPFAGANLVIDSLGRIRWYQDTSAYDGHSMFEYDVATHEFYAGGGAVDIEPVTVWDTEGKTLLEWKDADGDADPIPDHDLERVGDTFYMITQAGDGEGGNHCLAQYDWKKTELWSWCTDDDPKIPDWPANSMAVQVTPKGDTFLYATMQIKGIIYKLNQATKEIVWVLSEDDGDLTGDAVTYRPWVHDLHVIECDGYDECLLMYVNGTDDDHTTWIRQVGIDETKMTATVIREWTEKGWEESKMGGIQQVGDNWLVCEGHFLADPWDDRLSQIAEVDPDGSVVWRLTAATNDIQMYRARRVNACDLFRHAGYCPAFEETDGK